MSAHRHEGRRGRPPIGVKLIAAAIGPLVVAALLTLLTLAGPAGALISKDPPGGRGQVQAPSCVPDKTRPVTCGSGSTTPAAPASSAPVITSAPAATAKPTAPGAAKPVTSSTTNRAGSSPAAAGPAANARAAVATVAAPTTSAPPSTSPTAAGAAVRIGPTVGSPGATTGRPGSPALAVAAANVDVHRGSVPTGELLALLTVVALLGVVLVALGFLPLRRRY